MKKDGKRMEKDEKHEKIEKDKDVEDVEDVEDGDGDGEYDSSGRRRRLVLISS